MRNQDLYESPTLRHIELHQRPLQISITLTEGALLIFLRSWAEKLLALSEIKATTLDIGTEVMCL